MFPTRHRRRFFHSSIPLALLALSLVTATELLAQFNLGTISGTVLDPSGGAVADCKVTVVSLSSAGVRTVKTNSSGLFTVASIPADTYTVTVEADGFRKSEARLNVSVNQTVTSDFHLVIGSVTEQMQVTEQATQLQL